MMTVIHKFQLQNGSSNRNYFYADIPINVMPDLLDVGAQGIDFFVWGIRPVESTSDEMIRYSFMIFATGEEFEIPETYTFWKRVEMAYGRLQFHVYRSYKIEKVSP